MKLKEEIILDLENKMNKDKKWYSKVKFTERDRILLRMGYKLAMKQICDEAGECFK